MLILLITYNETSAQLSPGPLSSVHEHLEGLSQCTKCHDIGQKVPGNKCLSCHDEIQSLIDRKRGFHANKQTVSQECIDCHSEHHGKIFNMVRFDTINFNHRLTGYNLEGQHGLIDCKACHNADNIFNDEIASRKNTFLGLELECISCHADYHQNTLSQNCASCHDFEAFRPATKFDHNRSKFKLKGEHLTVDCILCHEIQEKSGIEFQVFTGLNFSACISCHDDPHKELPGSCNQCHTEDSFSKFIGLNRFNHNLTAFELRGSHSSVACFECHDEGLRVEQIFQDKKGISEQACVNCHDDVHKGKFGQDCVRCHNENSFLELNASMDFDHSLTDFPLEGLHQSVDCKSCHEDNYLDAIAFNECNSCHEDYHQGEFKSVEGLNPDCNNCHTLYYDFTFTSFGPDEHLETDFPLEGSHLATPCFECHLSEEDWRFRDIAQQCVDCHIDIHEGLIDQKYYEEQNCTACHNTDLWSNISFDHDQTSWSLENSHVDLDCRACHFEEQIDGFVQKFTGLETSCYLCHENIHGKQFELDGITDCSRCHSTMGWNIEFFDHTQTAFPLEGRHAEIDCNACHDKQKENIVIFKIDRFECIDCHS